MDKKIRTISIRVTKELKDKLSEHCYENDKSVSKLVTRLIEQYLKEQF